MIDVTGKDGVAPLDSAVRDQVQERYAKAARLVLDDTRQVYPRESSATRVPLPLETGAAFGWAQYSSVHRAMLPPAAVAASLGCGSPMQTLILTPGLRVLDLGCGAGIDVLLVASHLGPTGFVVGLDVTTEMLELARANAIEAAATNVSFLRAAVEAVPLRDGIMDVVISNGVINFSIDKLRALREAARVLVDGGSLHFLDIVAEDQLTMRDRLDRAGETGCTVGALARGEYLTLLRQAGLASARVTFLHQVADGMHSALVQAIKATAPSGNVGVPDDPTSRA